MTKRTWLEQARDAVREVHPSAVCTREGDTFFVYAQPAAAAGFGTPLGYGALESLAWDHARRGVEWASSHAETDQ